MTMLKSSNFETTMIVIYNFPAVVSWRAGDWPILLIPHWYGLYKKLYIISLKSTSLVSSRSKFSTHTPTH